MLYERIYIRTARIGRRNMYMKTRTDVMLNLNCLEEGTPARAAAREQTESTITESSG